VVIIDKCPRRYVKHLAVFHHHETHPASDYTSLLELLPQDSEQHAEAKRELMLLKPRVEKAQKAETAEMLDKLKGLGNSLLGERAF